jgi:hypothetical protein
VAEQHRACAATGIVDPCISPRIGQVDEEYERHKFILVKVKLVDFTGRSITTTNKQGKHLETTRVRGVFMSGAGKEKLYKRFKARLGAICVLDNSVAILPSKYATKTPSYTNSIFGPFNLPDLLVSAKTKQANPRSQGSHLPFLPSVAARYHALLYKAKVKASRIHQKQLYLSNYLQADKFSRIAGLLPERRRKPFLALALRSSYLKSDFDLFDNVLLIDSTKTNKLSPDKLVRY